jgi:hypothetical protein
MFRKTGPTGHFHLTDDFNLKSHHYFSSCRYAIFHQTPLAARHLKKKETLSLMYNVTERSRGKAKSGMAISGKKERIRGKKESF